ALHEAIALVNPHPFAITGMAEVELQRLSDAMPFRVVGPTGEVAYEIVSRWPTDGPGLRPAAWLRLRLVARDLPPHGLRLLALEHRLRAHFALSTPPASIWTETSFGWIERTSAGTHPVSAVTVTSGSPSFAVGGAGLHEVERASDGALVLTLFRAVGWMSRGD